jgi:hypothetical protein
MVRVTPSSARPGVDSVAGGAQRFPDGLGVRRRRANLVTEAGDAHAEGDVVGADVAGALEGRRQRRCGGAGERDVALAAGQPAGGVEADPAGPGEEDLAPGVQVDDVARDAARLVGQHALVGELHQVAGGEARRQPAPAQDRRQQHRRVAAGGAPLAQADLGGEDAGLVADDVADAPVDRPVEGRDQGHGLAGAGELGVEGGEALAAGERRVVEGEERRQLAAQLGRVLEGHALGQLLEDEVEGVHRPHVEAELDEDVERADRLLGWEIDARDVVAVGILLPAHPVLLRDDQAVGLDARPRVCRGAETEDVGAERRRRGIAVVALMLEEEPHRRRVQRGGFREVSIRAPAAGDSGMVR